MTNEDLDELTYAATSDRLWSLLEDESNPYGFTSEQREQLTKRCIEELEVETLVKMGR